MSLEQVLRDLPGDATEAVVEHNFSKVFLNALGFENLEILPQFPVGRRFVDQAARKNPSEEDIFLSTRKNPYLYMEVKGRGENLSNENHPNYRRAAFQLKQYLLHPDSKTVKWGIITNANHVQLFRKHGKVIHPITPCLSLEEDFNHAVSEIKGRIESPARALMVAVYNNKGGVGKTTTTLNLAAALTLYRKRVLIVDFDPNQSDLGDALNLKPLNGKVFEALTNKDADIKSIISTYRFEHPRIKEPPTFDVILADEQLVSDIDEASLRQQIKFHALRRLLESIQHEYDYILIDAPPNWRIFAQKALYAADVVLIPARHDNLHSLQNAGTAITRFIPETQIERRKFGDAGPIALPIFLNNAFRVTPAQVELMHQAIESIIKDAKRNCSGFDLKPYF